jgi:penicillin-binding protein 1A
MNSVTRALLALSGVLVSVLILAAAGLGAAWYYLSPGLPSAETMREVRLQVPLRVYSRDGRLIAQLGEYRRIPVAYEDIPQTLVQAFLAAEDDRFFEHPGIDYQGIIRAGVNLLATGSRTQGGSTITQQLARAYFLSSERSFVRKAREILLALQIEQKFTKEEILALYLNKIFLGQRAYGVAAAAEVYFGKPLKDLTVAEAATIAGIPKAPSVLNPAADPDRARERRGYVLRRMRELGFIDEAAYAEAVATPVSPRLYGPSIELDAPYVAEMARAEMVGRFGQAAYTDGYHVVTTIDSRLQRAADLALRTTLLEYDRRHGYRGPVARDQLGKVDPSLPPEEGWQRLLDAYPVHAHLYPALVTGLTGDNGARLYVHDVGVVELPYGQLRWRRYVDEDAVGPQPRTAGEMVAPGDVVYLLRTANRGWILGQLPEVQGALVALDPRDGATVALAGGYDFFASKFNRAVQARRQPGSSFKPFIYSAALENGFTPATLINDAPVVVENTGSGEAWRPENSTGEFNGPTRLREGLVKSLNLVSIRVLDRMGVGPAIEHVRPFGLPDSVMPRNLTMALGSGGASPREMAGGFAGFASGGYRIDPYLVERIEDSEGRTVFRAEPRMACASCAAAPPTGALPAAAADAAAADAAADTDTDTGAGAGAGTMAAMPMPATFASTTELMERAGRWQGDPGGTVEVPNPAERIIPAENAYIMYDMMRDVIRRGTARRALALGRGDLAGKTGTSNDRRDAWFSGYNADLVATAWVGFDQERPLGNREEGGRTALPMWTYFMADALRGQPASPLPRPPGVVTARIDPDTGQLTAVGGIFELFREQDLAAPPGDRPGALAGPPPRAPGAGAADIF